MNGCTFSVQSNLSYPDSCYLGTSLNRAADLPYFILTLQKLWAVQWVWPITAYVFILYSEIRTNLSYGHSLIPRCPDKRGLTVQGLAGLCCLLLHIFYCFLLLFYFCEQTVVSIQNYNFLFRHMT